MRGCVALERGPQVYCVEQVDLPEGIRLDDVVVDPTTPPIESDGGLEIAVSPRPEVGPLYGPRSAVPTGETGHSAGRPLPHLGQPRLRCHARLAPDHLR